jgi:hypothetical protein
MDAGSPLEGDLAVVFGEIASTAITLGHQPARISHAVTEFKLNNLVVGTAGSRWVRLRSALLASSRAFAFSVERWFQTAAGFALTCWRWMGPR